MTTRNLLRQRATTAIMLGDEIDSAPDTATLGQAWAKLSLMAKGLLEEEVDPRTVAIVRGYRPGFRRRLGVADRLVDLLEGRQLAVPARMGNCPELCDARDEGPE